MAAAALTLGLAIGALAGWACGETGDTDPTPVTTFKITPAAGGGTPQVTPAVSPTAAQPTPATAGTPGTGVIAIAASNSTFDTQSVEAAAGSITVEFDNQDGGVVHNIHFYKGNDAKGESVADTDLAPGPVKQTLNFDAQAGSYYYQCDAHPTTMKGKLTVQ
jgi:plastocyanin